MTPSAELAATAQALMARGKGLLAADESFPTIARRFKALGIPSTEETRGAYREMLLTTPGLGDFISGVILFDETIRQRFGGLTARETLARQGIIPGIKVDFGTVALPGFPGEKITQGLDGLRERLAEYRNLGARFTKWRAVVAIGEGRPSHPALAANARSLALFAALSQEAGLVPIVEPEVLMDGDHLLARCEEVTGATLEHVFDTLREHRVLLSGMLLKTGMVLPGEASAQEVSLAEVATATVRCLRRSVPTEVAGVVFLSGGQSGDIATARLDAICRQGPVPWRMSFSFGRALQDEAMKTWHGSSAHATAAQAALLHRARCNGLAVQGKYSAEAESATP